MPPKRIGWLASNTRPSSITRQLREVKRPICQGCHHRTRYL